MAPRTDAGTRAAGRPMPSSSTALSVAVPDQLAVDDISLVGSDRHDPRHHRAVGRRQDDDDPDPDRRPRSRPAGEVRVLGEDPRHFRRADPRADRLHAPVVHALPGPHGPRERRLRRVAVRHPVPRHRRTREVLELVDLWDVRGRRAGRAVGRHAAPAGTRLRPRPRAGAALPRRADRRASTRSCAARIWEELHRLRDAGRTLLVTTQYVNEAEECDTVALIADGRLVALATPDELRREAVGGDVVEIETAALFDGAALAGLPLVTRVRQDGPRRITVIVDDAGTALPDVVEAVRARGGEVTSGREDRPSFDEVFATLVERDRPRPRRRPRLGADVAEPTTTRTRRP